MSWLSTIIAIVTALPSLIGDIEALINAVAQKPAAATDVKTALVSAVLSKNPDTIKNAVADSIKLVATH